MPMRLSTSARNAAAAAVAALADAGAGVGQIKIYTGAQPANPQAAPTGIHLLTYDLVDPAYTGPVTGTMTLDADPDLTTVALADGSCGWGRLTDSDGLPVYDGECSLTAGTGQFRLNALDVLTGQEVVLTQGSLTQPEG